MNRPGPGNWREMDCFPSFCKPPYAGVVKRVGVGGCSRSSRTFFFIFVTLGNRKKSSKPLAITTKVCQSKPNFLWHRSLVGSELSRSIPCLPFSRFGNAKGRGCGRGRTHLHGERDACLSAAAHRSMEVRRCIWLRGKDMRRWLSSFWRRGRSRMRKPR